MRQSVSVITLGVSDRARSRAFYVGGFGWTPVLENPEIVFYQLNGLMLGTWAKASLEGDMQRRAVAGSGAVALAHNVESATAVDQVIERLRAAGGQLLRAG